MMSLFIGGVLFAYTGMLALCQGLERHYKQVWSQAGTNRLRVCLRVLGWLALGVSFAVCVSAWGWAMGPVGWLGAISLAGFALVLLLPYGPRLAVYLAGAGPLWAVWMMV